MPLILPPRWQEVRLRKLRPSEPLHKTVIMILVNGSDGRVRVADVIDFKYRTN